MKTLEPKASHKLGASCVRFNVQERTQIEEDSVSTGKSIPTLLKESYFGSPRPLPLMTRVDVQRLNGELGRIGNNINQLARRLNSGIREGFMSNLDEIQRSFDGIWLFLVSQYCRCKKPSRP